MKNNNKAIDKTSHSLATRIVAILVIVAVVAVAGYQAVASMFTTINQQYEAIKGYIDAANLPYDTTVIAQEYFTYQDSQDAKDLIAQAGLDMYNEYEVIDFDRPEISLAQSLTLTDSQYASILSLMLYDSDINADMNVLSLKAINLTAQESTTMINAVYVLNMQNLFSLNNEIYDDIPYQLYISYKGQVSVNNNRLEIGDISTTINNLSGSINTEFVEFLDTFSMPNIDANLSQYATSFVTHAANLIAYNTSSTLTVSTNGFEFIVN